MLTVDLLAENHRRIYEAVRDAGEPLAPKDIETRTGLPGSTVRPTLGVMLEKGLLERPIYGMYTVVPLDRVGEDADDPETMVRQGYEAFVQAMPFAVALLDTDLRFLSVNAAYLTAWDLGERDIVGQTMYEVFPDVSPEGRQRLDRVLAGESIHLGDPEPYSWRRADGRVYWSRLRMFPWHAESGDVAGIVVMCAVSEDVRNVPSLSGAPAGETSATGAEKMPQPDVDNASVQRYDRDAHQEEDMIVTSDFIEAMGKGAQFIIDPAVFLLIARLMAKGRSPRVRITVEKDDPPKPHS